MAERIWILCAQSGGTSVASDADEFSTHSWRTTLCTVHSDAVYFSRTVRMEIRQSDSGEGLLYFAPDCDDRAGDVGCPADASLRR